ncbi:GFA family protein [Rhizobium leguminosarum]|uniref:GFA family protein n=1 Tax=Rhizobium leguminosarum TaxID=384 RepID=UPI001C90A101|nr:GFA family protein [Rhizobium leguminosarum]MBY2949282.1 GFA family protein [Rhizobium leguminosarum]
MESTRKHMARCACGAVRFGFDVDPVLVVLCHCLDCKKASGGEALCLLGVPEGDFTLSSGQPKAFRYTSASENGPDRNFCAGCGSRLFTSNLPSFPGLLFVTLASLDRPEGIRPAMEIFTSRRLDWATPLDVPQFDTMPG